MTIGTAIPRYTALSWDGVLRPNVEYTAKKRGEEVLQAMKRVTTREYGDIPGITKPGHTPSLLEVINYRGPSCETLQKQFQQEVRDSQRYRKGVKVAPSKPKDDTSWIKDETRAAP